MTKYILAGGCDRRYPEYLTQLARVIHDDFEKPKILSVWFSNSDEVALEKFPKYKEFFMKYFVDGTEFIKAEKDKFLQQVEASDVIYFHGGHTTLLLPTMEAYGDMKQAFDGKIVVGSSAGANYLSRFGFSPSKNTVGKGSGLTSLSTIVHFGSRGFGELTFQPQFWQNAAEKMKQESGFNEVTLLYEGTFVTIEA